MNNYLFAFLVMSNILAVPDRAPPDPAPVTRIALAPGPFAIRLVNSKKKLALQLITGDKVIIEAQVLYLSDGKGHWKLEATPEGIRSDGRVIAERIEFGSGIWTVPSSPVPTGVVVTSPSAKFNWSK
jgi:hypothetical protein